MLRNFSASSLALNPSFPPHKTALLGAALFTGRQGSFHGQQKQTLNYSCRRLHHNRILNKTTQPSYNNYYQEDRDPILDDHFPKFQRGSGISKITEISPKYKQLTNDIHYMDVDKGTGSHPKKNQKVDIEYKLYDVNRKLLDEKRTQIMVGTKKYGPGFDEAIEDMRKGGRRIILIPPSLAKGGLKNDYIIYDVKMCQSLFGKITSRFETILINFSFNKYTKK